MAVAVPPSAACEYMRTLTSTLAVPSMFATYKLLTLKILPLLAALLTMLVSGLPVPTAALSMLPLIVATFTIFGFAMFLLRESLLAENHRGCDCFAHANSTACGRLPAWSAGCTVASQHISRSAARNARHLVGTARVCHVTGSCHHRRACAAHVAARS